jgi:excisionase family DNA binding protein
MESDGNDRLLWTVQEVADLLRVTPQSITSWIRQGKLESIRIGRAYRIPKIALTSLGLLV